MPVRQAGQPCCRRIQCRDDQLRGEVNDLSHQTPEVVSIELRRWVIHEQDRHTGIEFGIAPELCEQQRRGRQFLLSTRDSIAGRLFLESDRQIRSMRTGVRQTSLPVSWPGSSERVPERSVRGPAAMP